MDTTGGVLSELPLGHVMDRKVRGQHYDEVTVGYERLVGEAYRVGLRGTLRVMRAVLEDVSNVVGDPGSPDTFYIVGNPGHGRLRFLASYVLSRTFGNYPGLYYADARQPAPNASVWFDFPPQLEHATGYLPNDRRHLLKFSGSYRIVESLSLGTVAALASGLPLSELASDPFPGWVAHVVDRGSAGRTPATWTADLRVAYDLRVRSGRWRPRVMLDVFNLGNQRRAIDIDQLHYTDAARALANPNYRAVNRYQAPLSARLGVVVGF